MSRKIITVSREQLTSLNLEAFVAQAAALNQRNREAWTTPFPTAPERWLSHSPFMPRSIAFTSEGEVEGGLRWLIGATIDLSFTCSGRLCRRVGVTGSISPLLAEATWHAHNGRRHSSVCMVEPLTPSDGLISFVVETLLNKALKHRIGLTRFEESAEQTSSASSRRPCGRRAARIASDGAHHGTSGSTHCSSCPCLHGHLAGIPRADVIVLCQLDTGVNVLLRGISSNGLKTVVGIENRPLRGARSRQENAKQ